MYKKKKRYNNNNNNFFLCSTKRRKERCFSYYIIFPILEASFVEQDGASQINFSSFAAATNEQRNRIEGVFCYADNKMRTTTEQNFAVTGELPFIGWPFILVRRLACSRERERERGL